MLSHGSNVPSGRLSPSSVDEWLRIEGAVGLGAKLGMFPVVLIALNSDDSRGGIIIPIEDCKYEEKIPTLNTQPLRRVRRRAFLL